MVKQTDKLYSYNLLDLELNNCLKTLNFAYLAKFCKNEESLYFADKS